ncbi:MAG TPA: hydantoinase B/oxoprolinase family protein [Geminicoccaceae bacterium]|nr:hydantoinase B/oxoprolinase family protein [Geminicoccaceae bacterium]
MPTLDPGTLAVLDNGLVQVCNEMDVAFSRAAFSPVIAEANDRSDGIYHRDTGELIAQGELGLPVFVGTMQYSTMAVLDAVRSGRATAPRPGDVYILNDPYLGGTHLMDVKLVEPFFHRGQLFCWLANTGHWPDIGGAVPGGFSANATEVEQEGLRLPPVKLYKAGRLDDEIYQIITANIRLADQRIGDIRAQRAALEVGGRRLTALLDRYGPATVDEAILLMRGHAERQMRARIRTIPDGTYDGEAVVDSDGVVDEPLVIRLRVTKEGSELRFDLSRSSPPCQGPMNSVIATTRSAIWLSIKHIFPEVPINAGMFEPLVIQDPEGTFLYARYPRPVSGCAAEVSQRIAEAVFAAMVQAIPERVTAAPAGTSGNFALGGWDAERQRPYVMYHITGGGYGGNADHDGLSYGCSTIGISKSAPLEVLEQQFPVLFLEYALAEGSGGAGRRRGGMGLRYALRLTGGEARASFVMDHGRVGPQGALGGGAGGLNQVRVDRADGSVYVPPHLSKDQGIRIGPGDVVRITTPGGGGYGDPRSREPERVLRDVRRGYYAAAEVLERFGVVVRNGELDLAATLERRRSVGVA